MTHADDLVPVEIIGRKRTPGFLLAPFGWAAEPLPAMVQAEPSLLADLFAISRPRMHLIALALAHLETTVPPEIGALLVRGSVRQVLDRVLAQRPVGIKRVLDHLPVEVLSRENYRRLVTLLADLEAAKVLHHADKVDDVAIRVLADLPQPLRRPLTTAVPGWSDKLDGLADGLRFLVSRGVAPSFDEVVADLLSVTQYGQLAAKFGDWVDGLPLPESDASPNRRTCSTPRSIWRRLCARQEVEELSRGLCASHRCGRMRRLFLGKLRNACCVPGPAAWPVRLVLGRDQRAAECRSRAGPA